MHVGKLPDFQDCLKFSTSLLYRDIYSSFNHLEVDLTGTSSYFDIGEETYSFGVLDLCRLLPLQVRPKGMSQKCKQLPDKECQHADSSEIALRLERSFQDPNNTDNLVTVINNFVPSLNQDDLSFSMKNFCFPYLQSKCSNSVIRE